MWWRRVLSALLVIFLAATVAFFLLRLIPGDAISTQLAMGGASQADIARVQAAMGLDEPLLKQYGHYMWRLMQGDLGYSLVSGLPVHDLILSRLGPTAVLALTTALLSVLIGFPLGVLAAKRGNLALIFRIVINLSISTPIYWTGTLAIILFSARLGWLPSTGTGSLAHLVLPVGVLVFHTMGPIARVAQINVWSAQQAPFVMAGRGRGLPESLLLWRYVLRTALVPVLSVVALQLGFLLSGTVITESLFARPGVGRLLLDSTIQQDYPVVQGIVILMAAAYTTVNALADVVSQALDPRVRA